MKINNNLSYRSLLKDNKSNFAKTSLNDMKKAGKKAGEALGKIIGIPICTICGSEDVIRNAEVSYHYNKQKWDIVVLSNKFFCKKCNKECEIKWITKKDKSQKS